MNVVIVSRTYNVKTKQAVDKLTNSLESRGVNIFFDMPDGSERHDPDYDLPHVQSVADLAIAVGGDGTVIHATHRYSLDIAGVNTGNLGYLSEFTADEIDEVADLVIHKEYYVSKRMMLAVNSDCNRYAALNEITVSRTANRLGIMELYINDTYVNTYRTDGLLISTPTGSTAYNLSAGGPIVDPEMNCIIITPVSPHSLTNKPIVVHHSSSIKLVASGKDPLSIVSDSIMETEVTLEIGEALEIKRCEKDAFIVTKGEHFTKVMRSKLGWGS